VCCSDFLEHSRELTAGDEAGNRIVRILFAVLGVLALMLLLLSAPTASAGDAARGSLLAANCIQCHGEAGISRNPGVPNLAGQSENYIALQLVRYRDFLGGGAQDTERRQSFLSADKRGSAMDHIAGLMSNEVIADLAAYFSALPCEQKKGLDRSRPPPTVEFCASCHGETGVSTNPGAPNLAGQHQAYLVLQLDAFRTWDADPRVLSAFPKRHHPFMSNAAKNLSISEIRSVAAWYSSQSCAP
jgi:cytochrome c553